MEYKYFFRVNARLKSPTIRYVIASSKFDAMEKIKTKIADIYKDAKSVKIRLKSKEKVEKAV